MSHPGSIGGPTPDPSQTGGVSPTPGSKEPTPSSPGDQAAFMTGEFQALKRTILKAAGGNVADAEKFYKNFMSQSEMMMMQQMQQAAKHAQAAAKKMRQDNG